MKIIQKTGIGITVCTIAALMACNSTKNAATNGQSYVLNGAADSACYAIGISYGNGLKEQMKVFPGGGVNLDALAEGFLKAIRSDSLALLLTPEEAQAYIQAYIMGIQVKEAMAEKEKGEQFLAANKTQEGVITTESGLQYKIIKQGEGEIPTAEDQVKVHYTGKLLDGTTFDSSVQRGEPAVFGVKQVIPGWTEVLQLMPVGSKYEVWIPSELGYGTQGAGQMIKPNNVLNFEVELLEIVK